MQSIVNEKVEVHKLHTSTIWNSFVTFIVVNLLNENIRRFGHELEIHDYN